MTVNNTKFKFSTIIISLAMAFGLTACGSNDDSNVNYNTTPQTNNNSSSNNSSSSAEVNTSIKGEGFAYDGTTGKKVVLGDTSNLKEIVIDGTKIKINEYPGIVGSLIIINGQVTSGTNYKDSAFGSVEKDGKLYLYAQGVITAENQIPTTGTAQYIGSAAILSQDVQPISSTGDVNFNVNFADKSIDGVLKDYDTQEQIAALNATINGNKFNGVKDNDGKQVTTTGQFNGTNAREMSGTITSPDSFNASFGAIKQ